MPWLTSAGVGEELGLPAHAEPLVALVVGYPAEQPAGQPRPRPAIHWCAPPRRAVPPVMR